MPEPGSTDSGPPPRGVVPPILLKAADPPPRLKALSDAADSARSSSNASAGRRPSVQPGSGRPQKQPSPSDETLVFNSTGVAVGRLYRRSSSVSQSPPNGNTQLTIPPLPPELQEQQARKASHSDPQKLGVGDARAGPLTPLDLLALATPRERGGQGSGAAEADASAEAQNADGQDDSAPLRSAQEGRVASRAQTSVCCCVIS
eukprot:TRINITY_DN21781_c0_g1_i1.p1 TRINITY_DN21781_c0_g1~~TRINITY_DN21781_c0_g1_i1.p1  ORF type:complete len:221 (+),score=58.81 TRINITY_DN21781_c0_g1_i1:56-664(+)